MSGQAPPAIPHTQADREALLRDAEYFAAELTRRVERLAKVGRGHWRQDWRQAAALARRIRALARYEGDEQRRRVKREAMRG
jgi:hypothetical protein